LLAAAANGDLVISVQDSGTGVPADLRERIWEPFFTTRQRGTGLGLAIVHRIVTDYNGSIQVSSTEGNGTTIRVRLPMRVAKPTVVEAAAVLTAGAAAV
jgi:signal transduction histidine kinase